jgi:tRNA-(ms[2]io[6]A)-hydroxylase
MSAEPAATGLDDVLAFLPCATPDAWFRQAAQRLPLLLVDHANCEKKAAGTALSLLYRHVDKPELLQRLSRLAREELRHFEQVHALMQTRGIDYVQLGPSRYAAALMAEVRRDEPGRLVDTLLVGAIVEARSCERFAGLAARLPEDVAGLYRALLASEARHFRHYLALAEHYAGEPVGPRLDALLAAEAELVTEPDRELRFHSGPLAEL